MGAISAIKSRRTIRKFTQEKVSTDMIKHIIDAARFAPQGSNMQPMRFLAVTEPEMVKAIFENVRWAAYIAPEGNPLPGEEPTAYILMLCDTSIKKDCDVDAGAMGCALSIAAHALGLGTCWMGGINRPAITELFGIKEPLVLHTLFALGYPAESPEAVEASDSIKYFKDESGRLHVPKRKLSDILYFESI